MTRPIGPGAASLQRALDRQAADAGRFPEGAVLRITQHVTLLQQTLLTATLRTGELWVVARAEPGQVTLVNPRDGRQVVAGQDTLDVVAVVVT